MASLPDPIDIHVGERLRARRGFLGMTQEQLGTSLGITFQQVQKYERGANRIGASRLYNICRILDVAPQYFFAGLAGVAGLAEDDQAAYDASGSAKKADGTLDKEARDLIRAFRQIKDPAVRRRILELARTLSAAQDS